jgi:hypothetical protein
LYLTLDLKLWADGQREYEDYRGAEGGVQFIIDAFNPFGVFHTIRRPSLMGVAHHAYVASIMAGGMALAASFSTASGQGLTLQRYLMTTHWLRSEALKKLSRFGPGIARAGAYGAGLYAASELASAPAKTMLYVVGGKDHLGPYGSFRNPVTGM